MPTLLSTADVYSNRLYTLTTEISTTPNKNPTKINEKKAECNHVRLSPVLSPCGVAEISPSPFRSAKSAMAVAASWKAERHWASMQPPPPPPEGGEEEIDKLQTKLTATSVFLRTSVMLDLWACECGDRRIWSLRLLLTCSWQARGRNLKTQIRVRYGNVIKLGQAQRRRRTKGRAGSTVGGRHYG